MIINSYVDLCLSHTFSEDRNEKILMALTRWLRCSLFSKFSIYAELEFFIGIIERIPPRLLTYTLQKIYFYVSPVGRKVLTH